MAKLTIRQMNNPQKEFVCQFNPTDFQISKTNQWDSQRSSGTNTEKITFSGGTAQDVSLKLLFDNTLSQQKNGVNIDLSQLGKAVTTRDDYKTLRGFADNDEKTKEKDHPNKGHPPLLEVQWGTYITFKAVITQYTEHFLLFNEEGDALRVEVSLTLKQATDNTVLAAQNPTSLSEPRRTWRVRQGERLDLIAYQAYGDSAAWRFIAQSNELSNPQRLRSGDILKLPTWQPE